VGIPARTPLPLVVLSLTVIALTSSLFQDKEILRLREYFFFSPSPLHVLTNPLQGNVTPRSLPYKYKYTLLNFSSSKCSASSLFRSLRSPKAKVLLVITPNSLFSDEYLTSVFFFFFARSYAVVECSFRICASTVAVKIFSSLPPCHNFARHSPPSFSTPDREIPRASIYLDFFPSDSILPPVADT